MTESTHPNSRQEIKSDKKSALLPGILAVVFVGTFFLINNDFISRLILAFGIAFFYWFLTVFLHLDELSEVEA